MELCECGHWIHCPEYGDTCPVCGCRPYKPRHDARYDPDDVADQGYGGEVNSEQLNYWRERK